MTSNHDTSSRLAPALRALGLAVAAAIAAPAAHAGPTIQVGDEGSLTINYALQVWMQNRGFTSPTDDGSSTDTFLRRNRVTFMGQYNDYVGFYAQLEAGGDSKGGVDNKPVFYRDAYVTLDLDDAARFIVGRFKNTFSRENLEACLEPLTMDRAEMISYTPFAGTRDTGLAMWGNLADARLQYRVMIADGREGDDVPQDSPRVTARVHYSALDPEFDYGYLGTYLGTRKVFTVGFGYDRQPNVAYANWNLRDNKKNYTGQTADVFFEYPTSSGTFTASAATFDYSVGNAINVDPDPTLPLTTELEARYVKLGYLLPGKVGMGRLQFFARAEDAKYNLDSGFLDQTWNGAGFHYYLDGQKLKLSAEHASVKFDKQNPDDPSQQDYTQTTLGLQLIF